MIQTIIVDDEPLARDIIKTHISKIPNWNVVATCINAEEAYEALLKNDINVIFLDIQMPVITGVEFLQSLKNPPLVIFTTADSEYAIKGFELNVIDYLLKPIAFSRFYQAIEKANLKLEAINENKNVIDNINTYFFVKHNGKLIKVVYADILYIKAEQEYSFIFTINDKLLVSMHLKMLEGILPVKLFTRVHRSYIIPQEKITSIHGNIVQIGKNIQISIGSKYKENLISKLNI